MNEKDIITKIQIAAYEVRLNLCQGYLEAVYKNALLHELHLLGLKAESEVPIHVYYKGSVIGDYKAYILVENRIIIELKAVKDILSVHETQLINYLTATNIDYGILINYGGEKFAFRVKTRIYNAK